MRVTVSPGPPAANGTMMVIGRDGKVCATALPVAASIAANTTVHDRDLEPAIARRTLTSWLEWLTQSMAFSCNYGWKVKSRLFGTGNFSSDFH
jgi:hypothetical protein